MHESMPKKENNLEKSHTKEGVDFLFEQYSGLVEIGTKEQYCDYLNTIFPESKTRNVLYHGSNKSFDDFSQNNDTYFSSNLEVAKEYQEKFDTERDPSLKAVLLNIMNPYVVEGNNSEWFKIYPNNSKETRSIGNLVRDGKENGNDGVVIKNVKDGLKKTDIVSTIYVVFNPSQIHILGSRSDVEKFKEFVSKQ